jgi:hypothetical protein
MAKHHKDKKKQREERMTRDNAVSAPSAEELKVLMRFSEHKFYNDLNKPIFEAGKIYELEGAAWIQRWTKRGGEIVENAKEATAEAHIPPPAESNPVPVEEMPVIQEEEPVMESPVDQDGSEE